MYMEDQIIGGGAITGRDVNGMAQTGIYIFTHRYLQVGIHTNLDIMKFLCSLPPFDPYGSSTEEPKLKKEIEMKYKLTE